MAGYNVEEAEFRGGHQLSTELLGVLYGWIREWGE
jgi:predicted esterase